MICNTIGLTADSFESIYTTGGTEVEEVYGAINYAQPIYAKIREMTGTSPLTFTSRVAGTLTDYRISGETIQNGTPSPDMPVDVVGCGTKTENLWDKGVPQYVYAKDYKKYNPDNAIALKAGTYTISSDGKPPTIQVFSANHTQLNVDDAITYTSDYRTVWDGLAIGPNSSNIRVITITLLSDCILTFVVIDSFGTYIMLNLGSTALPYEPYGYKLPVTTTNGTDTVTTPVYIGSEPLHRIGAYADYVDYASGKIVRKIKKLVLTGDELWIETGGYYNTKWITVDNIALTDDIGVSVVSTHYKCTSNIPGVNSRNGYVFSAQASGDLRTINVGTRLTMSSFKQFLADQYAAGTPVTIYYVLAEPIEEDPPVPFPALPTLSGTNTMSVDTTVKPSQMYIKGKIKPDGYGKLVDKNSVYILDKDGVSLTVHGQGTSN